MYITEQRELAIETYIKFDPSAEDTVAEPGCPTRRSLGAWCKDYLEHGEARPPKRQREPKPALEMGQAAVGCCLAHGKGLARTMRRMGHPASREHLCDWTGGPAPGQRKCRGPTQGENPSPSRGRCRLSPSWRRGRGPPRRSPRSTAPYIWCREMMGGNVGEPKTRGEPVSGESCGLPNGVEVLQVMLREAKMQLRKVQPELDVRQANLEAARKTRAPTRSC